MRVGESEHSADPDDVGVAIESLSDWYEKHVAPLEAPEDRVAFGAWREELSAIRDLIHQPDQARVALIGTTGAGKSTFLNAILHQEVLPVGVLHPCTAFVTRVSYASGRSYSMRVHYATWAEWHEDVELLAAMLEPGDEAGPGERVESNRTIEAARSRIQAVLGNAITETATAGELRAASLPAAAIAILDGSGVEEQEFADSARMLGSLRKLIHREGELWPLVREVAISGPYEALRGGIELVDLPGLNDPNEGRVEVTREYLRTAPFVWLVFPMVRGITADLEKVLREERILRTLVLNGTYSGLALVGTKSDVIDLDSAEQLGLTNDCSFADLVHAYRDQTVSEARAQLEAVVQGLSGANDAPETHHRMLEMARNVRVHTTSASAYNKLSGVGRLLKDYGLEDIEETGIPGVLDHLAEIGREAGAGFQARTAMSRAQQLQQEISLYLRAKGEANSPRVEQARATFRERSEAFASDISRYRERAVQELNVRREQFLDRLDPIFAKSVQGVVRVTDDWQGLYWSTLKAIVQRNGVFRSPSTGRSHDLNADVSEPLLAELPVSWEKFFTDDLGGVTREFVVRVEEAGKHFCDTVALIARQASGQDVGLMDEQLEWFQQKVELLANQSQRLIEQRVRERRSELGATIPRIAGDRMQPAYDLAKIERGSGVKQRILGHIGGTARQSARPMYDTMQSMILEGLGDLEVQITGLYQGLTDTAIQQATTVVNNASVGLDESATDPLVARALAAMPA